MNKSLNKAVLGSMAVIMGASAGVGILEMTKQPTQVEASPRGYFGESLTMATARAVYHDNKGNPGKKDAGYYKGTKYKVGQSFRNGYLKVTINGKTKWMSQDSVSGDYSAKTKSLKAKKK